MPYALSTKDQTQGFWYYRPEDGWPPAAINHPEDSSGESMLCVSLAADNSSARKKLIGQWCEALPTLRTVRFMWITGSINQALFDAVCQAPSLEGFWAKNSTLTSLAPVAGSPALRFLALRNCTKIEALEPLRNASRLEWLELENAKRVQSLEPLAALQGLKGLAVCGSMWATQRVDTLHPLRSLLELRYLDISNLRSADKTLRPLYSLTKLRRFIHATWWNDAEIATVHANNPMLAV